MDLTKALAPKTDQIDATDLIGKPPQVFTITAVTENGSELADQQPVNIRLEETNLFYRPSKGMLRVLADNWGTNVQEWVGRRLELYGDPNVYFGKEKRGGTRISRLSHITKSKQTLINPRGGRGAYWEAKPLPDVAPKGPTPTEIAALIFTGLTDATTEAEVREWGNRAHTANVLDISPKGAAGTLRELVTSRLADLDAEPTDEVPNV